MTDREEEGQEAGMEGLMIQLQLQCCPTANQKQPAQKNPFFYQMLWEYSQEDKFIYECTDI